jgi:hypothetical protein
MVLGMKTVPHLCLGVATAVALTLEGCGVDSSVSGPNRNAEAIHARFGAAELTWVITRVVDGREVTCGYEQSKVARAPFIARGGQVWQEADLAAGQFEKWEDQFCGPDWVKPLPPVPAPS